MKKTPGTCIVQAQAFVLCASRDFQREINPPRRASHRPVVGEEVRRVRDRRDHEAGQTRRGHRTRVLALQIHRGRQALGPLDQTRQDHQIRAPVGQTCQGQTTAYPLAQNSPDDLTVSPRVWRR